MIRGIIITKKEDRWVPLEVLLEISRDCVISKHVDLNERLVALATIRGMLLKKYYEYLRYITSNKIVIFCITFFLKKRITKIQLLMSYLPKKLKLGQLLKRKCELSVKFHMIK